MKTKKKVIKLTESDLHMLIEDAVKEALRETDYKRYHQAAVAANNRMLRKYPDAYDIDWDDEWSKDKKDEIDSLNKKKMDYLELRDKNYQEKHPNVTAHPYDTDSYIHNEPYIPQRFLYKYNQGKNTKIAERIPNGNWSERTKGRGQKPMTQDEFDDYNNIKSELERLKQ